MSQVEIEAGDSEGRLPQLFLRGLCAKLDVEMNIGITVYSSYGGSGIVGSELGKELAARGHTVHFIASSLPTRLTELNDRVRFHEVEMMSYPLFEHQPYTLALATKMSTVAEEENLDLLHVHYAIPHSISAILARESLKPRRRSSLVALERVPSGSLARKPASDCGAPRRGRRRRA